MRELSKQLTSWKNVWLVLLVLFSGCAEGPFWRCGKLSPWARNQWAEEEKIANTLFTKKQKMTEQVNAVINGPLEQQQAVAEELSEVVHRDPVLLLRLHAVKLIGQLKCPAAVQTLGDAARDYNTDIRIAAIEAWEKLPGDVAIPQLQEIIGSDSNIDVRLAATRALGSFSGSQAVKALSLALSDSDPALQIRATESLQKATGESLGRNVLAWQDYVSRLNQSLDPTETAVNKSTATKPKPPGGTEFR